MSHVEVCTAEVARPRAFASQCISTLLLAERARQLAEENAEGKITLSLAASNADVLDPKISWGTHLNASISSSLWEDLFKHHRHPALLASVSSAIAAGIAFFGQGYLLPMKDGTIFCTAGRPHHISEVHTHSTIEPFRRGILNERREPHAVGCDRLHMIGFDFSLASAPLLCSFVQCVLAAAEERDAHLVLCDPVRALRLWSWHVDTDTGQLTGEATLIDGRSMTLPQYMRELTERFLKMCESGLITPEVAPEALDILPRIIELTHFLEEGAINRCAQHLDWAAKLLCLLGSGKSFEDPAARLMDHDYSNTDPQRGAFWRLWEDGLIDPLVDMDDAIACLKGPPADTRAWARGKLIERYSDQTSDVNWSHVEIRRGGGRWGPRLRIEFPELDSLNRGRFEPILERATDVDHLEELLDDEQRGPSDPLNNVTDYLASPAIE